MLRERCLRQQPTTNNQQPTTNNQQPTTVPDCDFAARPATKRQSATLKSPPATSSSLVPTSTSNESHTRCVELRARSRYAVQRVSHSCRRASRSFQIRNSRSRSTEDRQPPCSASTTTRSRRKELNGAPLPCLPCFCSVSCAQGMTFCSTLKGCASHRCHCAESNVLCTSMACGWCVAQTKNEKMIK